MATRGQDVRHVVVAHRRRPGSTGPPPPRTRRVRMPGARGGRTCRPRRRGPRASRAAPTSSSIASSVTSPRMIREHHRRGVRRRSRQRRRARTGGPVSSSARAQSQSPVRRTSSARFPIVLISSARRPRRRAVVTISRWTATASRRVVERGDVGRVVAKRMARSEYPIWSAISAAPEQRARLPEPALEQCRLPDDAQRLGSDIGQPRRSALARASRDRSSAGRVLGVQAEDLARCREQR